MYNGFESMKGSLLEQMCAILDNHKIAYEKSGVEKNLNSFGKNKADLLNLLSKHPKWDEKSLAVVFEAGDIRVRNETEIEKLRLGLEGIAKEYFEQNAPAPSKDKIAEFKKALKYLCGLPQAIENGNMAQKVMQKTRVNCIAGQRLSRVVNNLCKNYKVNSHESYISVFTPLADALNPLSIKHKAVLSLNPCDFLEMSSVDGWNSDFRLGTPDSRGSNIAGTLSFMNDGVSMVFYCVDNSVGVPYYKATKINSEIFCFEQEVLVQSRLYPDYSDKTAKTTFRNLVQKIFAECLEQPNLWVLKTKDYSVAPLFSTNGVLENCRDFYQSAYAATASLLKIKYPNVFKNALPKLIVGQEAYCVKCGNAISAGHMVYCNSCTE